MEDNDTHDPNDNTAEGLNHSHSTDGQTHKEKSKSDRANGKSEDHEQQRKKKWSLIEHWKRASKAKQVKWVFEGIGLLIAFCILCVYIWGNLQTAWNFRAEHAPLVIHNRLPQFLQTYKCIPVAHAYQSTGKFAHGDFCFGNIDKTYKNIGDTTAYDVSGVLFERAIVVPVKRTGDPFYDERLKVNPNDCATTFRLQGVPLERGIEETIHLREGTVGVPPQVKDGDLVTFDYETCTTYADKEGIRHGTCDLYSLYTHDVLNLPSVDKILGTPELPCDGVERTGSFVPMVGGHCQK
jgi:hypothetical protein